MTADTVGGVWTYAIELAQELGRYGIEVGLATMGARLNLAQKAEVSRLKHVKVFESCFKLEWMEDPRSDVERAGQWLLELEQAFRPDLVHLNSYSHGAFPWKSPKIVVGHSCVLSWWRAVHHCDAPAEWDQYREDVMAGLHGAEMVIAPSHAMMQALNEHYGGFKASCVIYNGRAIPGLQQRAKHDIILAAGRLWDAGKNLTALADIAPRLPWPVCIAGQEHSPDGRGVSLQNVSALGHLSSEEMLSCFERATIYALPARYEPFGLSAVEAGLAGCALVLGDIPSLREVWGDAALFVSPDSHAALERALTELISNPVEIARLAAAARERAGQFTRERMAAEYLRAYEKVLQRGRTAVAALRSIADAAVPHPHAPENWHVAGANLPTQPML